MSCRLWSGDCPCVAVLASDRAPDAARALFVLALHDLAWRCASRPLWWGFDRADAAPGGEDLLVLWDAAGLVATAAGGLRVVWGDGFSEHAADELRDGDSALWAALGAVPRDPDHEAWVARVELEGARLKRTLRRLAPDELAAVRATEAELAWRSAIAGDVRVLPRPLSWLARDTPY